MEKTELQLLEEKLKLANLEIAIMKREARKHFVAKIQFEKMKGIQEEQVDTISKTLDNTQQLIKWTIPVRKEEKHVRRMNTHLKATNRRLRNQVKDLQEKLELIHDELHNKGLKMTMLEEPIGQPIINEEEMPKGS